MMVLSGGKEIGLIWMMVTEVYTYKKKITKRYSYDFSILLYVNFT